MSQDHLFSAIKRPRETLSVLPSGNMYTGIPQPASTVKRSNSQSGPRASTISNPRMSLAPRGASQSSSSAGNLADMGFSTVKRESNKFSSRKSYAPGSSQPPASSTRRSSQFQGRQSMGVGQGAQSFFTFVENSVIADPRPLKTAAFKQKMMTEITDYLLQNGFEMDMKHTLGPNSLKSPTQKDFATVFQWLYQRLDPHHRFVSVEKECLSVLKFIRYPYAHSITKSQLSAVGSQNAWPQFLGILHWMMEVSQTVDRCHSGDFDEAAEQEGIDVSSDKITFRYITNCYNAWLLGEDNHDEFEKEMAESFEDRYAGCDNELQMLEAENTRLKAELEELEKAGAPLKKLKEERAVLEEDKGKFVTYIDAQVVKSGRQKDTIETLKSEIAQAEASLRKIETEKMSLQAQVDAQGLTPADIDRMNSERDKLNRGLGAITTKLLEVQNKLSERETDAQSKLEALERAASRYTTLAYKIQITPSSAQYAENQDWDLTILPLTSSSTGGDNSELGKLLIDQATGYQPAQLLNRDLRADVKPFLNKLKQTIGMQIHSQQDEACRMQEYMDRIMEAYVDKKDELETLDARVAAANNEYQELKETIQEETNISNAELEKQAANLQAMRVSTRKGLLETEQKLQSITMECDQLYHAQSAVRERLHAQTKRIVEEVVDFKVHVQSALGECEARTEAEVAELFDGA